VTPILVLLFLTELAVGLWLRRLNLAHLARHGAEVPVELRADVPSETLARISAYTRDRARAGLIGSLVGSAAVLLFVFGLLGAYDRFIAARFSFPLTAAMVFFLGLSWASTLLSIPLDLYLHFVIEERHGFNRMSVRLWLADLAKSTLISSAILCICVGAAALLVEASPGLWWLWVWLFLCGLSVLLLYVSPILIEPLFFRMKPLSVPGLEREVQALAERAGVHVKRVLEVDASRRSSHSNAYFTGLGSVKRVVLFDTLLERMSHAEILAVLAHELGHWKKHHILQRLLVTQALALAGLYVAHALLAWPGLPALFGLEQASLPARALLVGFLASLASFPLTPLGSYWSRRNEWQADAFAVELTHHPEALASALAKLARDNLSNLHPHPLYAAFYYSHPEPAERVRALRAMHAASS
jgi:STE24 endopeptidase